MKYKFKIDYIPNEEYQVISPKLKKGEVIEVVGYSEPAQSVVCFYKGGVQINIPIQVFLLITEEYYEPVKPKLCALCKHLEKCKKMWDKGSHLIIGDFCAKYEESTHSES